MRIRVVAVLAAAIALIAAFAVTRPVQPLSPASGGAPITAEGYSRYTPAGHKYFTEHGELLILLGHDATDLALPPAGASKFAPVPPITVVVHTGTGEEVVDDIAQVILFTGGDRVTSLRLTDSAGDVHRFTLE